MMNDPTISVRVCLRPLLAALVMFFSTNGVHALAPVLRDGDLVAVCGDSITEQRLYSLYIQQYLMFCQPAENLMAMQFGSGGERAFGLATRAESDVLVFKPTVVTTCYGMNDGNYAAVTPATLAIYRKDMTAAVKKLKAGGVRVIVVGGPGVADLATYKRPQSDAATYNATLAAITAVAREIAETEGVLFADVHAVMMDAMLKARAALGDGYKLANDGIHPLPNGHLAMAYAFLKALGVDGDIGTLTVDYPGERAVATAGHRVMSYKHGVLRVESTRYPFCFTGAPDGFDTLAMSAFLPFNEDLNRYRLVVREAPPRTRITWGTVAKEFSAEQLAAGINLAAEFPANPFGEPFATASKALQAQQVFETAGIKNMLNPMSRWTRDLPEGAAPIEMLRALIIAKSEAHRAASRAAVKPVTHEIKIERVE